MCLEEKIKIEDCIDKIEYENLQTDHILMKKKIYLRLQIIVDY